MKALLITFTIFMSGCFVVTTNKLVVPKHEPDLADTAPIQTKLFWQERNWNSHSTTAPVTTWDNPWASDPVAGYNNFPRPRRGRPSGHLDGPPYTPPQGKVY